MALSACRSACMKLGLSAFWGRTSSLNPPLCPNSLTLHPRQGSRAKARWFDHRVTAEQAIAESFDRSSEASPGVRMRSGMDAHQHEARHRPAPAEHQFAEIFVLGQKHLSSSFARRITSASLARGATSAVYVTSWPANRSSPTSGAATHSSASQRTRPQP